MSDTVNHPPHYNSHPSGVEAIEVSEHFSFNVGNALKYMWRCGHKGSSVEDLKKAAWYLERAIARGEMLLALDEKLADTMSRVCRADEQAFGDGSLLATALRELFFADASRLPKILKAVREDIKALDEASANGKS